MSSEFVRLPKGTYVTLNGDIFKAKKLVKLGRSLAFVLPKKWCKLFAKEGYVGEGQDADGNWIIRALTEDELEVVLDEEHRDNPRGC